MLKKPSISIILKRMEGGSKSMGSDKPMDSYDEPEEGADEGDNLGKETAANDLIRGIKQGDPAKVVEAFSELMALCGDYE